MSSSTTSTGANWTRTASPNVASGLSRFASSLRRWRLLMTTYGYAPKRRQLQGQNTSGTGGSRGPPCPPQDFFKSSSFQASKREAPLFLANVGLREPWGQNSGGPPDQNPGFVPGPQEGTPRREDSLRSKHIRPQVLGSCLSFMFPHHRELQMGI